MVRALFNRIVLRRHVRNYQCNQPQTVHETAKSDKNAPAVKDKPQDKHVTQQELDNWENRLTGQQIKIIGYKKVLWKTHLSFLGIFLTLGFLRLIFYWFPKFWIKLTHKEAELKKCERVLVEDTYIKWKTYTTTNIECLALHNGGKQFYYLKDNKVKENENVTSFMYKSMRYVLEDNKFERLEGLSDGIPQRTLHESLAIDENAKNARFNVYGPNEIKVPLTSILQLILLEILTPFYVFQLMSIVIWITEGYVYFVIVIMTLTVFGVASHVYQTRKNQKNLRSQVKVKDEVVVYRQSQSQQNQLRISSINLVPGDLISLNEGYVYCDAILLSGNCLVDESMLTGESIQVLKTPIPNNSNLYNLEDSSSHVLSAGTKIVQANGDLRALVTKTGFLTSKGSLIRSIMYPPPVDYKFERDCSKYCIVLFLIGFVISFYVAYSKAVRGISPWDLIIKTLDSITILLPAALPAAMTIGKLRALNNLKKVGIFCTNSKVMNVAGAVDCVCLDKTGTITEDQLDFIGVVLAGQEHSIERDFARLPQRIIDGMSTCHNLALFKQEVQGDPLEVQMFKAVNSRIVDQQKILLETGELLDIEERYQFSSNLRRMSVLVKNSTKDASQVQVFCKGSPEIVRNLCKSLENADLQQMELDKLTKLGYRILAIAAKTLPSEEKEKLMSREDIERDLDFLGFLVFENQLKKGSTEIINELKLGNLQIKMITGDNIETAISVAKECGILSSSSGPRVLTNLDQFAQLETPQGLMSFEALLANTSSLAVTGNVWQLILAKDEGLVKVLLPKTQVFARMASHQKQQVIEQLQSLNCNVCMCGDGTNDCSALKAANVGISLTESESSIASHLTSKIPNISAVLEVIREGRAALVTTISIVKIILAGNMVQYIGMLILYEIDASFADRQFLYLDFHMLLYSFFVGYVNAAPGSLSPVQPTSSLLSWKPILSVLGFMIPTVTFQYLAMYLLRQTSWFVPYVHNDEDSNNFLSYENFVILIIALFQYSCLAAIFSRGKPYRNPIWTNWLLCLCIVVFTCINLSIALVHSAWLESIFQVQAPPEDFRWVLVALGVGHLVSTLIIEEIIIEQLIGKLLIDKLQGRKKQLLSLSDI